MRLDSSVTITSVKLMDGSSSYLFILSSFVPAFLLMVSLQHLLFFPWNQLETHAMSSLTLSVINVTRKQTASSPQQLLPRWDSFRGKRRKPSIHSFIHSLFLEDIKGVWFIPTHSLPLTLPHILQQKDADLHQ